MNELLSRIGQALRCCLPETEEEAESLGCAHCPHGDDCRRAEGDVNINERIVEDVRALVKALEPRVLTLDEALEADVCWLEISGSDRVPPCRIGGLNDFFSIRRIDQTHEVCAKKNYGWLLRCWSARPTEEQRKAVKWNG